MVSIKTPPQPFPWTPPPQMWIAPLKQKLPNGKNRRWAGVLTRYSNPTNPLPPMPSPPKLALGTSRIRSPSKCDYERRNCLDTTRLKLKKSPAAGLFTIFAIAMTLFASQATAPLTGPLPLNNSLVNCWATTVLPGDPRDETLDMDGQGNTRRNISLAIMAPIPHTRPLIATSLLGKPTYWASPKIDGLPSGLTKPGLPPSLLPSSTACSLLLHLTHSRQAPLRLP